MTISYTLPNEIFVPIAKVIPTIVENLPAADPMTPMIGAILTQLIPVIEGTTKFEVSLNLNANKVAPEPVV